MRKAPALYQRLHRVLTASAACSRAECVGKSGAAAVAALNGVKNLAIGNTLANTNVHGVEKGC